MDHNKSSKKLPRGWTLIKLGDIVQGKSKSISPINFPDKSFELYSIPSCDSGQPEIVLGKDIGSSKQIVSEGMVLLSKINPRLNRSWVVGNHSQYQKIASGEWIVFSKLDQVDSKYLQLFLKTHELRDFLTLRASGVGGSLMRVKKETLRDYPFPLPPLAEQRRIVEKINMLLKEAEKIEYNLLSMLKKNEIFALSLLKNSITGQMTEAWREKRTLDESSTLLTKIEQERIIVWKNNHGRGVVSNYPSPQKIEDEILPEIPVKWTWASLDQVVKEGHPIVYGIIKPGPNIEGGVPIIKVNNIVNGAPVDINSLDRCSRDRADKFPRSVLHAGDLVISKDGSIGRIGIIPKELEGGNVTQHVMKISPHSLIHGPYLMKVLQSPFVQKWLVKRTKGVALQGVNVEDFRKIPIPIPPREEQFEIARSLDVSLNCCKDVNLRCNNSLNGIKQLKQIILIRAFEGKLVPQSPNDEPASVLLEKIKAGKAKKTTE